MKKLILLVSPLILLVSCSSRDVNFRVKKIKVSSLTYDTYTSSEVEVVKLDSSYRAGDTVLSSNDLDRYLILEKVK
jgi:hypothetical protein